MYDTVKQHHCAVMSSAVLLILVIGHYVFVDVLVFM